MSEPPQYPSYPSEPNDSGSGSTPPPPPPPPPSGGYGSVPPPPPPPPPSGGGYGSVPPPPPTDPGTPGPETYSPTEAIGYGWRKFRASPGTLLVPVLVLGVGLILLSALLQSILVGGSDLASMRSMGPMSVLVNMVTTIAAQLVSAALIKAGLEVVDGRRPGLGELFAGWDKVQVLIAALLIGVLETIGILLCIIPGLIVAFLVQFTMYFIVDRGSSATQAIKESFSMTSANVANILLFFVLAFLVTLLGALACFVGLLVAVPVVIVAQAYTFRVLQRQPVSQA